jgi:NADH:ubiquinone oxidoreductase subunit 3 (subunit A)
MAFAPSAAPAPAPLPPSLLLLLLLLLLFLLVQLLRLFCFSLVPASLRLNCCCCVLSRQQLRELEKVSAYECSFDPLGEAHSQFYIGFYLV